MKIAGEEGGRGRVVPDEGKTWKVRMTGSSRAIGAQTDEPRLSASGRCVGPAELKSYRSGPRESGCRDGLWGRFDERTKSVVHAVASGKQAAMALDTLFQEGIEAIVSEAGSVPGW